MKKNVTLKERASVYIIGRGLIIISILVTVSLGFLLGYFVGKTSTKGTLQDQYALPVERQEFLHQPGEEPPQYQIQPQITVTPEGTRQSEKAETKQEFEKKPQVSQKSPKTTYTVQAGAFKDSSDADILKAMLEKKGYNTYIKLSESNREGKLYKVWIGDFDNRKEAEMLSMKIKKTEGLQTFVTLKRGQ